MMKDLGCCIMTLTPNGTPVAHFDLNSNINDLIRATLPIVLKEQKYWVCAIGGYEDDERELYEIPEVRAYCRRLVDEGFIASLHPTTLFFQDKNPEIKNYLGGVEVWAIGEGLLDSGGSFYLTPEIFKEWEGLLKKAEKKALALVRPQDGQHGASVSFSVN